MGFLFRLYGQAGSDSSQFERVSNMPLFSNKEISNFVQFYYVYLFNCVCKIDVWNEKKKSIPAIFISFRCYRSTQRRCSVKKGISQNSQSTLCEISKTTSFTEHLQTTASGVTVPFE